MTDGDFRERIKSDPRATLEAEGLSFPDGAEIEVLESTESHLYLVLPPLRDPDELVDEDLAGIAGGAVFTFF